MKSGMKNGILAALAACLLVACGGGAPTTSATSTPPAAVPAAASQIVAASTWWQPTVADTWQWQLRGTINTSYPAAVYDVDLFDTPITTIQALQASGKKVVCYFSAGSSENWRPDFPRFQSTEIGNELDDWPGENWLDTRSSNVRDIMRSRLDLAHSKGCDGVEPDNVDGYANDSGFPLDAATQLDFNLFLAGEAHARGLAVALKNDVDQLPDLVGNFDFAVNEQCHQHNECDGYQVFTSNNKPVFNAEYAADYTDDPATRQALCADALARRFHTLVLPLALDDSFRYSCEP